MITIPQLIQFYNYMNQANKNKYLQNNNKFSNEKYPYFDEYLLNILILTFQIKLYEWFNNGWNQSIPRKNVTKMVYL